MALYKYVYFAAGGVGSHTYEAKVRETRGHIFLLLITWVETAYPRGGLKIMAFTI